MAEAAVKGTPASAPSGAKSLVRVENVVKHFPAGLGTHVHAVDGVSFDIREGETLGLVGESGCGKSTLARLVTQLLPVTSGKIFFGDVELTRLRGEKLRQYRRQLQMIFQDPFASLDPRMTVGDIIAEPLDNFRVVRGRRPNERVQGLPKIVEIADSVQTYASPKHPYTKALLSAIPVPDPKIQRGRRLVELTGEIPSPIHPPSGCRFHTRCPIARLPAPCSVDEPPLEEKGRDHLAACFFSGDV